MYRICILPLIYFPLIIFIRNTMNLTINLNILYFVPMIIAMISKGKSNKNTYIHIFITILIILTQIIFDSKYLDIPNLFSFITALIIFYTVYLIGVEEILDIVNSNLKKINIMVITLAIINSIYFIIPLGWNLLWGENQFVSVYKFPHDSCYMFIGLQAYSVMLYFLNENKYMKSLFKLSVILFSLFSFFTNARTPFILSAFICMYFLYKTSKSKLAYIYISINFIIIVLILNYYYGFIDLSKIPIINKFIRGIEIGNVSSSRDVIWENILDYYKDILPINLKIIGGGFGLSRHINQLKMGESLWSHNDFLEVLLGGGIIFTLYYIINLIRVTYMARSKIFTIICIIVAFYNGLYVYQNLIFCLPILISSIKLIKDY